MNRISKTIQFRLEQLARECNAHLSGDGAKVVTGVNTIQDAGADEICFLSSEKHASKLAASKAAAVLTARRMDDCRMAQLVVGNVDKALIAIMTLFAPKLTPQKGIHPKAIIEPDAVIDPTASIGAGAYIGHGVTIGANTAIGPNCSIGENTTIGANSRLDANVSVYHNCKIGNYCIIQSNSTIGSTGFGYSFIDGRHQLIPHNGGVIIEDGVEIGANTCIDRAKFGNTIIGAGTKIDNLSQIAHNVVMGKACLMAGQAGIGGSACLGDGVVLGGRAGVSDNVSVASGTIAGVSAIIVSDTQPGQKLWGTPAIDWRQQMRCTALFTKLPDLAKEVKTLSKRVEKIEAAKND
jgi:UDP-3-O-[3-hydroxymyristoyl] glucosamine N-acyltransferase